VKSCLDPLLVLDRTSVVGSVAAVLVLVALDLEHVELAVPVEGRLDRLLQAAVQLSQQVLTVHLDDHLVELIDKLLFLDLVVARAYLHHRHDHNQVCVHQVQAELVEERDERKLIDTTLLLVSGYDRLGDHTLIDVNLAELVQNLDTIFD